MNKVLAASFAVVTALCALGLAEAQTIDGLKPSVLPGNVGYSQLSQIPSWLRQRTPSTFKNFTGLQTNNGGTGVGSGSIIWTPASGKKFVVMGICVSNVTNQAELRLYDSPVSNNKLLASIPTLVNKSNCFDFYALGYLFSSAANNSLYLAQESGLNSVAGGTVWGTEE